MAEVVVWRCALRAPTAAEADLLDRAERERSAGFRFDDDRHRFVLAAALARAAVADRLGVAATTVELERSCDDCGRPHGRPVVRGGGPHLSISHAGRIVVVAVADRPVGVDVEELARWTDGLAALVDQVVAPGETVALDDGGRSFFELWTTKEAVLKATGQGLRIPMREVVIGPRSFRVAGEQLAGAVAAFDPGNDHLGAVAVLDRDAPDVRVSDGDVLLARLVG